MFSLGGGFLFDIISPKAPFILIGAVDASFMIIALLSTCCGVLTNDILQRDMAKMEEMRNRKQRITAAAGASMISTESELENPYNTIN
jgi:hypothetical protein